jgi:glutamyl-tRNA reductase
LEQKQEIERFAEQLVNKLLHQQISAIKAESRRQDAASSLRVLARVLGIEDDTQGQTAPGAEVEKKS